MGQKTRNLVLGNVGRKSQAGKYDFAYFFVIQAPALSYEYRLFSFYYGVELYPVKVVPDDAVKQEMFADVEEIIAHSEEEFMEILKKIFAAEKTTNLIAALLSQIQAIES